MQLAQKSCYPKISIYHYYKNLRLFKGRVYKYKSLYTFKVRDYFIRIFKINGDGDSIVFNFVNNKEMNQLNTINKSITKTYFISK